ncbi:MAG: SUMF1/EgtB/PvdO family nonheme iron enzyme, partial [Thermodesulfobacteriota bacterium]|nr:SUMF1/EgtB/PvdO family nonheme iron enzyme [Thermodesulfobacteriota bacterium]
GIEEIEEVPPLEEDTIIEEIDDDELVEVEEDSEAFEEREGGDYQEVDEKGAKAGEIAGEAEGAGEGKGLEGEEGVELPGTDEVVEEIGLTGEHQEAVGIEEVGGSFGTGKPDEDTGGGISAKNSFGKDSTGVKEGKKCGLVEFLSEEIPEDEYFRKDELVKAKILAEKFEDYLDITKKFFNRHIWIPGGDYKVGRKNSCYNEREEKKVLLKPFYIGEFPVINGIFKIFIEKTGYKTSAERVGYGVVYEGKIKRNVDKGTGRKSFILTNGIVSRIVAGACWRHPFGPGSSIEEKDTHPVVQVSIEDARAFASWTGKRLPDEDEWEVSAKSSDCSIFTWGNEWKKEYCNSEESWIGDTTPVDYYQDLSKSPFGICDLLGNIMEWTSTIYEHSDSPSDKGYVIKGGSFVDGDIFSSSRRIKAHERLWSNIIGFRCAV